MPKLSGGGGEESMGVMIDDGRWEDVEVSIATAAKNHGLGAKVLHRKAEGVKFY